MEAAPASEFPPGVSACRALVLRLLRQGYTASSAAAALESGALFASPEKRSDLLGALASLLDDCLSSDETNSTKGAAHAASPEKEASSSSSSDAENFPPSKKRAREACVKDADGQCVSGEKASGSLILDDTLAAHSLATLLGVLEQVENPPPSLSHPSVARAAASSLRCFFSFLRGFRGGQAEEDAGGSPAVFADAADIQRALDLRVEALAKLFLKLKASSAGARSAGVGGQHLWVACGARLQRLREWTAILPRLAERRSELVQKLCASSNLASLPSLLGDPQDVEAELRLASELVQLDALPLFGASPSQAALSSTEALKKLERAAAKWREEVERQAQQQREVQRRTAFSRACVEYVLARQTEQRDAAAAASNGGSASLAAKSKAVNHPFFLLGLDPRGVDEAQVRRVQKHWRSLLHPDKFSRCTEEQQRAATEAFKTFQVALADAQKVLRSRAFEASWQAPPQPPNETSFADNFSSADANAQGPSGSAHKSFVSNAETSGAVEEATPNCMYTPEATVEPLPRRKATGAFRVYIQAPTDLGTNDSAAAAFRSITKVWVYVHRPVRGGPPLALVPSSGELSLTLQQEVQLRAAGDGGGAQSAVSVAGPWEKEVAIDVPAVQPLTLDSPQRYWVGVQVRSRKGRVSLVKWISLTLAVSPPQPASAVEAGVLEEQSSASARAAVALLQTFVGAPFLSRGLLESVQASLPKLKKTLQQQGASAALATEALGLLEQCMQSARVWADSEAAL